jgi:hypothetical protein
MVDAPEYLQNLFQDNTNVLKNNFHTVQNGGGAGTI